MGHLIPAGTGLKKYKSIILTSEQVETENVEKEEVQIQ